VLTVLCSAERTFKFDPLYFTIVIIILGLQLSVNAEGTKLSAPPCRSQIVGDVGVLRADDLRSEGAAVRQK